MRLFLQLIRKMTSTAHDRGMDEWLSNNHLIQDVNLITIAVEIHEKCSAKQDLSMCEEWTTYAGEILGKPRGFGQRYVGAISP